MQVAASYIWSHFSITKGEIMRHLEKGRAYRRSNGFDEISGIRGQNQCFVVNEPDGTMKMERDTIVKFAG
jgi:hypothetical protein